MFDTDADASDDRTFSDVARHLERWFALHAAGPSRIEMAWTLAGFGVEYGDDLTWHHVYCFTTIDQMRAYALLPAWAKDADPRYRAAILYDLHRYMERQPYGRACAGRLHDALNERGDEGADRLGFPA